MTNKIIGACKPALLGVFIGSLASSAVASSVLTLTGGVGLESHDNAARISDDEESDIKQIVNADIGYVKTAGVLDVDLQYGIEYGDYKDDVDEDETAINGSAALKWQIAPRRLDAVFNHQITQQLTDRRGLDVASNREERSVSSGGLDGYLHLSAVDSLVLSPRYIDVRFDESDSSDSQHAGMTARLEHRMSAVSALDLSVNYDEVTFDDEINDYDLTGALLAFRTSLSRLSYQIGLGMNRISRDVGDDVDGETVHAAMNYRGDEGREWGASYVRQLSDSSIGLAGVELSLDNFSANDSNFEEFDIVQTDQIDAYWRTRTGASSQLSFGMGYQKQNYEDTPQDQNLTYIQAGYVYTINSRWSLGLDGRFERSKFLDDPEEEYDTTQVYLSATYRPLRPLEVRFSIGQDKRDSDIANRSYTDNVAMIGMRYRFF